jgi:hypothetical protein
MTGMVIRWTAILTLGKAFSANVAIRKEQRSSFVRTELASRYASRSLRGVAADISSLVPKRKKCPLIYFEVMSGEQTQQFAPNFYVDITEISEKKREAYFLHASQQPSEFYAYHEQMERFRGLEYRCS